MIAVLTADLVNSTKLDKQAYLNVIDYLKSLLSPLLDDEKISFEIFRGDSFQVVFTDPVNAMRISLMIKLALLAGAHAQSIKVTQSLAIGTYDHLSNKPGESSGEVFIKSGRELESTTKGNLSIHSQFLDNYGFGLTTQFLNHHLCQLSNKQAEVAHLYLKFHYPEQGVIASKLQITRQNVAAHLKRGGAELIKAYILEYEALMNRQLEQAR